MTTCRSPGGKPQTEQQNTTRSNPTAGTRAGFWNWTEKKCSKKGSAVLGLHQEVFLLKRFFKCLWSLLGYTFFLAMSSNLAKSPLRTLQFPPWLVGHLFTITVIFITGSTSYKMPLTIYTLGNTPRNSIHFHTAQSSLRKTWIFIGKYLPSFGIKR